MKKENRNQKVPKQRRILGRMLARELGDEEMKLILAGFQDYDGGPSTMLVTGAGYEDN